MYQQRLLRLLLLPSLISGSAVTGIALAVLGYSAWLYIGENQLFYNYLFGVYGLKTYVWQLSVGATAWDRSLLGSPLAYYMLVGAAASAAGLLVYTLLQWLSLSFSQGRLLWRELHTSGQDHRQIAKGLLARLGLRTTALVGWGVYAAAFFSIVVPFCIILNQNGVDRIHAGAQAGWLSSLGALAILLLTLHLHIVFLRLVFLRPRLIGGDKAIAEAEAGES